MTIKTIQQYATEKKTSQQNVRNKKKLPMVKLPIYALHRGEYIHVGEKLFVECENKSTDNQ